MLYFVSIQQMICEIESKHLDIKFLSKWNVYILQAQKCHL